MRTPYRGGRETGNPIPLVATQGTNYTAKFKQQFNDRRQSRFVDRRVNKINVDRNIFNEQLYITKIKSTWYFSLFCYSSFRH